MANNDIFSRISLKAFCAYEKLTGKNSMELFQKQSKSMTDLRDMVFLVLYTKDPATTFDTVENLSSEEFNKVIEGFKPDAAAV